MKCLLCLLHASNVLRAADTIDSKNFRFIHRDEKVSLADVYCYLYCLNSNIRNIEYVYVNSFDWKKNPLLILRSLKLGTEIVTFIYIHSILFSLHIGQPQLMPFNVPPPLPGIILYTLFVYFFKFRRFQFYSFNSQILIDATCKHRQYYFSFSKWFTWGNSNIDIILFFYFLNEIRRSDQ